MGILTIALAAVTAVVVLILWKPGRESIAHMLRPRPAAIFDKTTGQRPIHTHAGLDSVISRFPVVAYEQLPDWWIQYTESNKMKGELSGQEFLVVRGAERFRYLVRGHRVNEFLPKDSTWFSCEYKPDSNCVQYWMVKPLVLHKFLILLDSVTARGLDPAAIEVRNGFRHHRFNFVTGGAPKSRHRLGDAIDLQIGDLDRNGREEKKDKDIILDLLDKYIIRNSGGVGRYPSTQSVHMDVRGHRARWDSYTPANQLGK